MPARTNLSLIAGAFALIVSALPLLAHANVSVAQKYIPNVETVGEGRLTFVFWDVYDAALYAPSGKWDANRPFALSLSYLRELSGADIAERSIEEIRDQGFDDEVRLATWYQKMESLFPDVDEKTTLTGVRDAKGHAIFYRNGERIGGVYDPEFSKWFFGIWLNKQTSEPELRAQLLGVSE